ncbi:hypothetical protein [Nocardioides sp. SR21]|uniref:hypothetical protein n=1 Tax=Nocardioides sp. SR21 TaxID=2919501 RepID=UPI001FAA232B|nr:hypothetical protein [Nocardioides sp. SR21]
MSVFQVVPSDMAAASNAVTSAGDGARGHGSSAHLGVAGSAVPGATSVGLLSDLGSSWDDEVDDWAADAASFGKAISAASDDACDTDSTVGTGFGGLFGLLPGDC